MPLKVIIVGGGIAGLSAAGYLRVRHEVSVLERGDLDFTKNDYGLSIIANAFNLLVKAGIKVEELDSIPLAHIWDRDVENHERRTTDFRAMAGGAPSIMTKRGRLQSELYRFATSTDSPGRPVKIVQNAKVIKVSADEGKVWTQDGSVHTGDLIIGADGINSYVRTAIANIDGISTTAEPGVTHDLIAFMTQVPISAFESEPALSFLANPKTNGGIAFWLTKAGEGVKKRILCYHTSPTLVQLVGYGNEEEFAAQFDEQKTSIIKDIPLSRVTREFSPEYAEPLVNLFSHNPIDAWRIRDVKPISKWSRGKALVIGDAAHAVTPHAGQGCNISIEDAEALGFLLRDIESPDDPLIEALERFVDLRRERAHLAARYSRQVGSIQREEEKNDRHVDRHVFAAKIYGYTGIEAALTAAR